MKAAIFGGGAAGFMGAITTARTNPNAKVTLFEATHNPLDKVRISGGGRCNVTHNCFDPNELVKNYPRGSKELLGPYHRFGPAEIIEWFKNEGVKLKAEPDGRMFPITDDSRTIVDCLINAAKKSGVSIQLGKRIKNIKRSDATSKNSRFTIEFNDGSSEKFDSILIATGNSPDGYKMAESTGHTVSPRVPSLFTFKIKDPRIEGLAGVSFEKVDLTMLVADKSKLKQSGPMLITHWGLSGPAVLKLSAWGARPLFENKFEATLKINFLPGSNATEVLEKLKKIKETSPKKLVSSPNELPLPGRYWKQIVSACNIESAQTWGHLYKQSLSVVVTQITEAEFQVKGKGIFKEEFVTCGGVDLKEVDFKTMQSKRCPGLYFAGEVLDIDGITGGFNFQSAWTTGWLAGSHMAGH